MSEEFNEGTLGWLHQELGKFVNENSNAVLYVKNADGDRWAVTSFGRMMWFKNSKNEYIKIQVQGPKRDKQHFNALQLIYDYNIPAADKLREGYDEKKFDADDATVDSWLKSIIEDNASYSDQAIAIAKNHRWNQPFYYFTDTKNWMTLDELKTRFYNKTIPENFDDLFVTHELSDNVLTCKIEWFAFKKAILEDPIAMLLKHII